MKAWRGMVYGKEKIGANDVPSEHCPASGGVQAASRLIAGAAVLSDYLSDNRRGRARTAVDGCGLYAQLRAGADAGPAPSWVDLQARGHWFEPSTAHLVNSTLTDLVIPD
jgi:hypothetical protein